MRAEKPISGTIHIGPVNTGTFIDAPCQAETAPHTSEKVARVATLAQKEKGRGTRGPTGTAVLEAVGSPQEAPPDIPLVHGSIIAVVRPDRDTFWAVGT